MRNRDNNEEKSEYENLHIEGRNSVLEALKSDVEIDKILFKKGEVDGTLKVIMAKAKEKGIVTKEADKTKLDFMSQTGGKHQGVIAVCPAHTYAEISDILNKAEEKGEKPFIIILDGITDPHNLGAIIRTAEACGAHGVIIPKRRAVGLTAIVSKAAAGALSHMLVAKVANISTTIDTLKQKGLWIASADMKGEPLYKADLTGAVALVIGSEGEGLGRLVSEKCDFHVAIPMFGKISSLNASVAAGVLMYEVVRRRNFGS